MIVTVGIPFYNAESYLYWSIKSVLNQSFKDFELILTDDGSNDGSLDIARSFIDPRIRVLSDGQNRGIASRLNEQIRLAQGKYFARMDGDDIMVIDRLEKQIKFLEDNPIIDVVGGFAYVIDKNNGIKGYKKNIFPKSTSEIIRYQGYFIHPTVVGKKEWFQQNQYDENLKRCQDFELWLRTYKFSKFFVIEEPLLFYREIETDYKQKYFQVYLNLKQILNKHKELVSTKQYYVYLMRAYFKYLFFGLFVFLGLLKSDHKLRLKRMEDIQKQLTKEMEF